MLKIKRAYEAAEPGDGTRILVDRLWPRGVSKDAAAIDEWRKDISPSDALRRWFNHDPGKWAEFKQRYRHELSAAEKQDILDHLAHAACTSDVTLVYAARDTEHNNARALQEFIS